MIDNNDSEHPPPENMWEELDDAAEQESMIQTDSNNNLDDENLQTEKNEFGDEDFRDMDGMVFGEEGHDID